ncbi:UNC-50 family protein isoform 2 [Galdieria sulphuraria]|uniref:UNC-50 family protein isoform 2 n=1 Tax=Galdieria sulphuraria TaxID=130081 RepID=M2Y1E4_GALSU|nr:UNC-50 family protein isoform 2 [Galdieria sulphuraria]EME29743.1 UNC-50 family protein isoform 2 [Galdieria sulphuraria]|eukprot:XP_005706263.1 UNC-50 family protein isoform 2 [Galdieria sulphuraria]
MSVSEYSRRVFRLGELDFEYAFWQVLHLCLSPSRVYRNTKYHKQTKNQWARDDPAFLLILIYLIVLIDLAYLVCFQIRGISLLGYIVKDVTLFICIGCLVTLVFWFFCNRFLRMSGMSVLFQAVESRVEWLYAFDVHCNSFLLFALINYVARYFLLPVIYDKGSVSLFFSNFIYFASVCYYIYITFLGYDILPFLRRTHYLLYLVLPSAVLLLSLCFAGVELWKPL